MAGTKHDRHPTLANLFSEVVARDGNRLDLGSRGDGTRSLTDYELASRLSYFLWSSMPDAELLRLAELST